MSERYSYWTPELDAKLIEMRGKSIRYGWIATALKVTKSAAIGRGKRLGLIAKEPGARKRKPAPAVKAYEPAPPVIEPKPEPVAILGIRYLDRAYGQCAFPLGELDDIEAYLVCGQPTLDQRTYCPHHHRICYTPTRRQVAQRSRDALPVD